MARNDGDAAHRVSDLFGVPMPAGTGAPGSPGADANTTTGPVVGNPVVSIPGMSSQLPEGRPTVSVSAGDTAGMSDDVGAHASVIAPGPQAEYLGTGAGSGAWHPSNPNAGR